jgi:diamine N-acetyltransferase
MSSVGHRVTLREITAETVRAVVKLAVADDQTRFVASNGMSLAQALFAPEAWYRAIYFDDEPVGFVMLSDDSLLDPRPEQPEIGVWRFMVDARYQGRGIGRAALQLIIDHVRRKGLFQKLSLSYVPEDGGPEAFYRSLGFRPTGEIDDGEVVMELLLGEPAVQLDARAERLLRLARDVAEGQADFHAVKGPGVGDRATLTYMAALCEAARHTFGVDLSEFRGCGDTALAADFYFPDEGVMVEIALGLPNPGSEFEKDIVKALPSGASLSAQHHPGGKPWSSARSPSALRSRTWPRPGRSTSGWASAAWAGNRPRVG